MDFNGVDTLFVGAPLYPGSSPVLFDRLHLPEPAVLVAFHDDCGGDGVADGLFADGLLVLGAGLVYFAEGGLLDHHIHGWNIEI